MESHPYLTQTKLVEFHRNHSVVTIAYAPLGSGNVLKESVVNEIAKKHNRTAAQVLLRYQLQRDVAVIPKSTNKVRIAQNLNLFDFGLTNDDIKKIETLNKNKRFYDQVPKNHKYYPFNIPY